AGVAAGGADGQAAGGPAVAGRAGVGHAVRHRRAGLVVRAARAGGRAAAVDVGLALVLDAVGAGRRRAPPGRADAAVAVAADLADLVQRAALAVGAAAVDV